MEEKLIPQKLKNSSKEDLKREAKKWKEEVEKELVIWKKYFNQKNHKL